MPGIIITPKVVLLPSRSYIKSNIIDDEFIRFASLYFSDFATFQIGYGVFPEVPLPIGRALGELIAAGKLRRLDDSPSNGSILDYNSYPHSNIYQQNVVSGTNLADVPSQARSFARSCFPRDWYMSPDFIEYCNSRGSRLPAVDFSILRKLHVPNPGTPIEKILKFREQRNSELHEFWSSLKNAVQFADLDESNKRIVINLEALESRLNQLTKALDAPWISRVIESFELKVMFDRVTQGALLASAVGASQGLAWPLVAATAVAGFVRPKIDLTPPIKRVSAEVEALSFVYHAKKDVP